MPTYEQLLKDNVDATFTFLCESDLQNHNKPAALELVLEFLGAHRIIFKKILKDHKQLLLSLLKKQAVLTPETLFSQLLDWKKTLNPECLLDSSHFESRDSMAYFLERYGAVPSGYWGTDQDVRDVLDKFIKPIESIASSGKYILPTASLTIKTSDGTEYATRLKAVAKKVAHIPGDVTVVMPVNDSNVHWKLAEHIFKQGELTAVTLHDSLSSTSVEKVQKVVKLINKTVIVKTQSTGVQRNVHSCMDFTVQTALSLIGQATHPIVTVGTNAATLRNAVVETIAENKDISSQSLLPDLASVTDADSLHKTLLETPKAIATFDDIFARKLQAEYKQAGNKSIKEADVVETARTSALNEYRLFRQSFAVKTDGQEASSNSSHVKKGT